MRFASSLAALFSSTALLSLACTLPQAAHAQTTVSFTTLGNFTQATTYSTGGITLTTNGTLNITSSSGVGVVGGPSAAYNRVIDNGESVLFTFDAGPATDVNVRVLTGGASGGDLPSTVEIFGAGGGSLGVFTALSGSDYSLLTNPSLSSRVNNQAISAFRITSGGTNNSPSNYISIGTVSYTPTAVSAVPEPGEWATMGMAGAGLCGLMVHARRKKANTGATLAA